MAAVELFSLRALMPQYLFRRSEGVIGILGRLITDAAQEAKDSGRETLDETLLDEIMIGREDRPADGVADETERAVPQSRTERCPGRSTVFDDLGPRPETATG
ncbi:hypothetical protein [Streptomyces sp. NPDC054834]